MISTQARHAASAAFFQRLEANKRGRVFLVSPLAYAEFAYATARLYLVGLGMTKTEAFRELEENGPAKVADDVKRALDTLDEILDHVWDEIRQVRFDLDLWGQARDLMLERKLRPYDAVQLASAQHAECSDIVTFDKDFDSVPDLMVWRDVA